MSSSLFGPGIALSIEVFGSFAARAAIERARAVGYSAIGIPAWRRDFAPDTRGTSGARDLAAYLGKFSLAVSWLSAGKKGRFAVSASVDEDVDSLRAVVALAGRLRAPSMPPIAITATVGALGSIDSKPTANARDAISMLAAEADAAGATLALGASEGEDALLDEVLSGFADAPVGRLIDPGAILFAGRDPMAAVTASKKIAAVRASDSSGEETNLAPGEGRLAWGEPLAALGARDYHGYVTVEFAPRGDASARAANALNVLRQFAHF
jgi:sugar phosphate isomerase/epimerase